MKKKLVACRDQLVGNSILNRLRLQAKSYKQQAAFTLIELLVVCGIIVFIAAAIFANSNSFNGGQIELANLAYDIGLSIREAQVYGISVERNSASGFNVGYGIFFSTNNNNNNNNNYTLFSDTNSDGSYESTEQVSVSTIASGFTISEVDILTNSGWTPVPTLSIIFVRPEPNAWINAQCALGTNGNENCTGGAQSARIVIESNSSHKTMNIIISTSGEISVSQT